MCNMTVLHKLSPETHNSIDVVVCKSEKHFNYIYQQWIKEGSIVEVCDGECEVEDEKIFVIIGGELKRLYRNFRGGLSLLPFKE